MDKKELNPVLPEGLSQDQYGSWKDKWGDLLHIIDAPTGRKTTAPVVVKSPENDRVVCGQFERFVDSNPDKAREILIQNCVLSGKETALENNFAFRAVSEFLIEQIPTGKVALKNS